MLPQYPSNPSLVADYQPILLLGNLLNCDQWLGVILVLAGKDLQPCQDCPHSILLADMIATSAETLFSTQERGVDVSVREVLPDCTFTSGRICCKTTRSTRLTKSSELMEKVKRLPIFRRVSRHQSPSSCQRTSSRWASRSRGTSSSWRPNPMHPRWAWSGHIP